MTLSTVVRASETGASPFAVRILMDAFDLTGDEPASQGGGGLGPSPFQLMSAALAECTAMTVRWHARRQGWPVAHVEVVVEHRRERVEGAASHVELFEKTVTIAGTDLSDEQRSHLIAVAGKCPVHRALEGASLIRTRSGSDTEKPKGEAALPSLIQS